MELCLISNSPVHLQQITEVLTKAGHHVIQQPQEAQLLKRADGLIISLYDQQWLQEKLEGLQTIGFHKPVLYPMIPCLAGTAEAAAIDYMLQTQTQWPFAVHLIPKPIGIGAQIETFLEAISA